MNTWWPWARRRVVRAVLDNQFTPRHKIVLQQRLPSSYSTEGAVIAFAHRVRPNNVINVSDCRQTGHQHMKYPQCWLYNFQRFLELYRLFIWPVVRAALGLHVQFTVHLSRLCSLSSLSTLPSCLLVQLSSCVVCFRLCSSQSCHDCDKWRKMMPATTIKQRKWNLQQHQKQHEQQQEKPKTTTTSATATTLSDVAQTGTADVPPVCSSLLWSMAELSMSLSGCPICIFYMKSCNFRPYKMQAAIRRLHRRWHHWRRNWKMFHVAPCSWCSSRCSCRLPFVCFNEIEFHVGLAPPQTLLQPQLPHPTAPSPPRSHRPIIFSARRVKANNAAQKINLLRFPIVQLNKQTFVVCALIKMKRRAQRICSPARVPTRLFGLALRFIPLRLSLFALKLSDNFAQLPADK